MGNARVIAITNQKGGVAKTTTAVCLASGLNERGKKSLLIDTDPQYNATDTYRAQVNNVATLYDVMIDGLDAREAIQHTDAGDIIAGDPQLNAAAKKLPDGFKKYFVLSKAIEPLKEIYDYIILDTPPQIGDWLYNALVASDSCIVPVSPDRYAFQGLNDLADTINDIKTQKPDFRISGLLLVRTNSQRSLAKETLDSIPQVCKALDTKCYKTKIRDAEVVKKSQANRMTLFQWEKEVHRRQLVATDYRNFIDEVMGED
ncbi:MAG: hypothetical protein E7474_10625 [Ruminococcaceae bacterium]|nr:hypothetical protein [Oscillospiraceae bacterium]